MASISIFIGAVAGLTPGGFAGGLYFGDGTSHIAAFAGAMAGSIIGGSIIGGWIVARWVDRVQ